MRPSNPSAEKATEERNEPETSTTPEIGDAADAERDEAMQRPTREAERRADEGTAGELADRPKTVSK